ncbi:MAG: hypothetical protein MUD12_06385 [Spirochaetes bacterium]|jgi:hypothetical protein|nr:hypothetical protein [Spirochaetota bacterium]
MKKTLAALMIMLFTGSLLYSKSAAPVFRGRVIDVRDGQVELKRGRTEKTFAVTDKTVVMRNGKEAKTADIEVCQVARAYYKAAGNSKKEIIKLVIIKESDCR